MAEDIDSKGDDKVFSNIVTHKMEPLRVCDIIRYIPHFDIGNTGEEMEGMVTKYIQRGDKF